MPQVSMEKVWVLCPACGRKQMEPATVVSTNCRACGHHIDLAEALRPAPAPKSNGADLKRKPVKCFECGVEQEVAVSAQSTMCRRCGRYIDLADYRITSAVSKNFKTKGAFTVEPKGYIFNTEAIVGEAVLKGKFLGKLTVERSLTIFSSAQIKGTFRAGQLVIPAGNSFTWKTPLEAESVEIAGELVADLQATKTVVLKGTARLFGKVDARALRVEEGAVFVGTAQVRQS